MRGNRATAIGVGLALLLAGCGGSSSFRRVTIPQGASLRAAADSLHAAGIVGMPRVFRAYARVRGKAQEIKAGTYVLRGDASWDFLLGALTHGTGIERKITIPEGWSIVEIGPALARALEVPEDSVIEATRDTALLRHLDIPTASLEGYLFPDTYRFPYGTSARTAVHEMVHRFDEIWDTAWDDRLQQLAMSRNDIVTLASIIEREARLPEERPVISAVYHNRLKAQMPLQADPTVQYALGLHRDRVYYRDLEVDSPYNTYRHPGLPPGPIASPGRASLQAALFPASVPYLFFVAHPDGHHEFRSTFEEHKAARQEVRRAARERTNHGRGTR